MGENVEATGVVYGDIVYADDSNLDAAAVHAGLLSVGESKCSQVTAADRHQ